MAVEDSGCGTTAEEAECIFQGILCQGDSFVHGKAGPILPTLEFVADPDDTDGKRTLYRATFHPLACAAILGEFYHPINYMRVMTLTQPLARWITNLLNDLSLILRTGLCRRNTVMKEDNATGRRYDREFKQNAVELVRAGRTVSRVARDLGVSSWSLGRWVQAANDGQAQSEPKTLAAESDEQRELRRLRQENDYLRQQRDILKKALGILSAEMPPHAMR